MFINGRDVCTSPHPTPGPQHWSLETSASVHASPPNAAQHNNNNMYNLCFTINSSYSSAQCLSAASGAIDIHNPAIYSPYRHGMPTQQKYRLERIKGS